MLATNFVRAKVPIKYGLTRSCNNLVLVTFRELHFRALTRRGVCCAPPSSVKIRIIRSLPKLRRPGPSFIETGTYLADTVALVRRLGHGVVSIELDPVLYASTRSRVAGDSGVVLDDAASFDGRHSRPHTVQVPYAIREINSAYRINIQCDIIAATAAG